MELEQPAPVLDSAATIDSVAPPENELEDLNPELEPQPTEEEELEEDLEGVKIRGKKEALERIKAERLMHKDYTQKTQTVAEERKAAEATKAQYEQATQLQQHFAQEMGELSAVDRQIAQYANTNWQAWADADPAAASKAHIAFTQLQTYKGQLVNGLTQKGQQLHAFREREDAKRVSEAEAVVMREVKDWGPERYRQIQEFAQSRGMDAERLRLMFINAPQSAGFVADAMKWRQLEQQRAKKQPTAPAPPVTRVGGGSAASTKPLSEVSDAEYIRRRREYISKHR